MCWYTLDLCPYPDHDPISALIFNPAKAGTWKYCSQKQPWGRLSCGCLIVQHPPQAPKSVEQPPNGHILAPKTNMQAEPKHTKTPVMTIRQTQASDKASVVPANPALSTDQGTQCPWCTTVLKLVSTKSKEIQGHARETLSDLEETMKMNVEWLKVQNDILEKRKEVVRLQQNAWNVIEALMNVKNARDETED